MLNSIFVILGVVFILLVLFATGFIVGIAFAAKRMAEAVANVRIYTDLEKEILEKVQGAIKKEIYG